MLMFYIRCARKLRLMAVFCSLVLLVGCQLVGSSPEIENTDSQFSAELAGNDVVGTSAYSGDTRSKFAAANAALEKGQDDIAKSLLLKLTRDAPELSSPWVNLGIAYRNLGADDDAFRAFEAALLSQAGSCEALNQLGIMARERGNFDVAEARYLECLKITPEFSEVHLNLGILYELYMGKYASALSEYQNYMAGLDVPDRRVGGWIKDLERRQSSMLATENF